MGQESKQESKKEKVIQAAMKLFSKHGYHETAVSEIADQAGVAKGTVYWYFDSKEKLFWEIIVLGIESLNQQIEEKINDAEEMEDKLAAIVRLYLNFFKEGKETAKMMQESSVNPSEYFYNKMHELRQDAVNKLAQIIEEGQNAGQIQSGIDRQEVANLILGTIFGGYNPHVYQLNEVEEKVDFILNIILNGIKT